MARLLPMIAPLESAFRVDKNIRNVLHIAHFLHAATHFHQRVVGGRARIGRVEEKAVREASAPTGGELPVLALDVMYDGRAAPGEKRRDDEAYAFAGARRRKGEHVFWAVVPQIPVTHPSEKHAGRTC